MRSFIVVLLFGSCLSFLSFGENSEELIVGTDISISVYPNPASDYLVLTPKKQYSGLVFKIYNSVGIEMYSDELDTVKKIDLTDFKSNIYIVNFYLDGECVKTERLIVRH
jgi:hypothetical protein